jgi:hypothetical protein
MTLIGTWTQLDSPEKAADKEPNDLQLTKIAMPWLDSICSAKPGAMQQ